MDIVTELYFESHITIEPIFDENRLELFKKVIASYNFKAAKLYMLKGGEKGIPNSKDSFCTARSKDYHKLCYDTHVCIIALQHLGFTVFRYKIENTLIDSKIDDKWNLL